MIDPSVFKSPEYVGLSRAAMLIHMAMCAEVGEYDLCLQISRSEFSHWSGLHFRSISRSLRELESAGFIKTVSRPDGDVPIYEICIRL